MQEQRLAAGRPARSTSARRTSSRSASARSIVVRRIPGDISAASVSSNRTRRPVRRRCMRNDVARDRKRPRRHRAAGLIRSSRAMELQERVLHEIVGERRVAALREQVAPQPRRQRGVQGVEGVQAAFEVAGHQPAQLEFPASIALRSSCISCARSAMDVTRSRAGYLLLKEMPNCEPVMLYRRSYTCSRFTYQFTPSDRR